MKGLLVMHVVRASDSSPVGKFKFQAVPRKGERITLRSADSPGNMAFYIVDEVDNWAEGVDDPPTVEGPGTVLIVTEVS